MAEESFLYRGLPEHGGYEFVADEEISPNNYMEGYGIAAKDIIDFRTPYFRVSPPTTMECEVVDDETNKYTITKVIDENTYTQEYIVKISGRGTDAESVVSMTLPTGEMIRFINIDI